MLEHLLQGYKVNEYACSSKERVKSAVEGMSLAPELGVTRVDAWRPGIL
jgi:hypothetical protein